jgi:hypothetical protein
VTQASEAAAGTAVLPPGTVRERPAGPELPWRRPAPPRPRHFRWFTPALALLLGGYLFFNKSFAYLHVPGTPVFVGEIVLGIGVFEALRLRSPWYPLLRGSPILRALLAFMLLCALRLFADLPRYHLDAVRDSSIWYYGAFAFLVAAAAACEPTFVPRLLRWYRRVLPWYFAWAPVMVAMTEVDALGSVFVPGTGTPINSFRYTDIAVHVGMGLAFLWLGVDRLVGARPDRSRESLISVIGLVALLAVGSQSRGGFLAALAILAVAVAFLPSGQRRRIALSGTLGLLLALALVLALDLKIEGERRDVSLQQVAANLSSLAGDQSSDDLTGTVEWRQGFWRQVMDDLLGSRAWLTGLGFGEILPERYEVDVGNTNNETSAQPLRSVHNSHLTLLARIGFPGFALWLLLWTVWGVHVLGWVRRRPRGVRDPATAMVIWLLASVPGFLIGAYFDPSLEGPHVAIWLFTVVGLGVAATRARRPVAAAAGVGVVVEPPAWPPAWAAAWSAAWSSAWAWAWARLGVALRPSRLLARVRRVTGRLGWAEADRALANLTGLAVGVFLARWLGVQEFGAFAMAFAAFLLVLGAVRGLTSDALAVHSGSSGDPVTWRWAVESATGTAAVVGLAVGAACVAAGLLLPGSTGAALLGLGLSLPFLLVQDGWRAAFLAEGRPARAFANDLVRTLTLAPAVALLAMTGRASVGWTMLAWGGSAAVAAAVAMVQARLLPRVTATVEWLRWHRDLAARSLAERLSLGGAGHLRLIGLAAIAGLAAAGTLGAAELLLAPVAAIVAGIAGQAGPGVAGAPARRLRSSCRRLAAAGAGGALVWGAAVAALPDVVGARILGSAWLPASMLLVPVTLEVAGLALSLGAWVGLRALAASSRRGRAQLAGTVVYLVAALAGTVLDGAAGAAWGSAAGALAGAGLWWWQLHRAVTDAEAG